MCIKVPWRLQKALCPHWRYHYVCRKEAIPRGQIKKSEVVHAVLFDTQRNSSSDGTYIRFDENAAVIIDKKTKEPKGTRIFSQY